MFWLFHTSCLHAGTKQKSFVGFGCPRQVGCGIGWVVSETPPLFTRPGRGIGIVSFSPLLDLPSLDPSRISDRGSWDFPFSAPGPWRPFPSRRVSAGRRPAHDSLQSCGPQLEVGAPGCIHMNLISIARTRIARGTGVVWSCVITGDRNRACSRFAQVGPMSNGVCHSHLFGVHKQARARDSPTSTHLSTHCHLFHSQQHPDRPTPSTTTSTHIHNHKLQPQRVMPNCDARLPPGLPPPLV